EVGDRARAVLADIGRRVVGELPARMPAAQPCRGEGVIGEQEVLDRMLLATGSALAVRGGEGVGALLVRATGRGGLGGGEHAHRCGEGRHAHGASWCAGRTDAPSY